MPPDATQASSSMLPCPDGGNNNSHFQPNGPPRPWSHPSTAEGHLSAPSVPCSLKSQVSIFVLLRFSDPHLPSFCPPVPDRTVRPHELVLTPAGARIMPSNGTRGVSWPFQVQREDIITLPLTSCPPVPYGLASFISLAHACGG